MSEYTPTTEQVREYIRAADRVTAHWVSIASPDAVEAFDRWLAAHDAEVRAEADAEIQTFREQYIPRLAAAEAELAEVRAGVVAEDLEVEWEYGWKSHFQNGEEYEWQACSSRQEAERQIHEYQSEEDEKRHLGGQLTYSLWKRTKSKAGEWVRVPVEQEGENRG